MNFHNSSESHCKKISNNEAIVKLKEGYQREINNSIWWMMEKNDRLKKVENAYRKLLSKGNVKCYWLLIGHNYNKFAKLIQKEILK